MHSSEKNLCIKCNGDGNLLDCADNDCPLSIHKECMGCPARFDKGGRFYCPYCWYRRSVAESRRARECMVSKKKALLIFMDVGTVPTREHLKNVTTRDKGNGLNKDAGSAGLKECELCDGGKIRLNEEDNAEEDESDEEQVALIFKRKSRGPKSKSSIDTGSKAVIKPMDEEAIVSDKKKMKASLPLTPTRRSSRRLSPTPVMKRRRLQKASMIS